jgi:hypothetical protein
VEVTVVLTSFERYLAVFDRVKVLAHVEEVDMIESGLSSLSTYDKT